MGVFTVLPSLAQLCVLLINTFEKLHLINLGANLRPLPATSKMEFFVTVNAVNYCHKEIHCRCWRGLRYVPETSYHKKFKNEQLKEKGNSNKNIVQQFFEDQFSLGAYFRGIIFSDVFCGGGAFFPEAFFGTPLVVI